MSFTKSKYDSCFLEQQQANNKSIFSYVVDNSKFINAEQCLDTTPNFIAYRPSGVTSLSIDVENELRGTTKAYSKCTNCNFQPNDVDLVQAVSKAEIYNKNECPPRNKILPNGYFAKN